MTRRRLPRKNRRPLPDAMDLWMTRRDAAREKFAAELKAGTFRNPKPDADMLEWAKEPTTKK